MLYNKSILSIIIVMACSCSNSNCFKFSGLFNWNKTSATSTTKARGVLAGAFAYFTAKGSAATAGFYGSVAASSITMGMLASVLDNEHALYYRNGHSAVALAIGIWGAKKAWAASEPCAARICKYINSNSLSCHADVQHTWALPINF